MKKLYFFISFLCLRGFFAHAQLIYPISTFLPEDSTAQDIICEGDSLDWFQIVTPVNGQMVLYTTAAVPESTDSGGWDYLGVEILGRDGNAIPYNPGSVFPRVGISGVPQADTFYNNDMAADTFYIRIDESLIANTCWTYSLRWHTIPVTYAPGALPDSFPVYSQLMPYNTPVTGNLGFYDGLDDGTDGSNDWMIIPPTDGTIKFNISAEAESPVTGAYFTAQLYDVNYNGFAAQYPPAGPFQSPTDSNFYWNCITGGDTFYLNTTLNLHGDAGYAYKISYTIIPPVYSGDTAPHDSFANALLLNGGTPAEGHLSFHGEQTNDYYEFYKPDTGTLTIYGFVESPEEVGNIWIYVYIYDSTQNQVGAWYPSVGSNSQPIADTFTTTSLPAGYYYLKANYSSFCFSYKFDITGSGIVSGINPAPVTLPLKIYPNPSANTFTVDFGTARNSTIQVYNALGELVETTLQQNNRYVILGEKLAPGFYVLKASDETGAVISQGKMIKTN